MLLNLIAFGKEIMPVSEVRVRVLFVCVENSNRSQMAEGFARHHGKGVLDAFSSGSRPSGRVNPKAIAAMQDVNIDLSEHWSKGFDELPAGQWDYVITMGCGDECPNIAGMNREDWALSDPRAMNVEEFNGVRDEIERRVLELIARIAG